MLTPEETRYMTVVSGLLGRLKREAVGTTVEHREALTERDLAVIKVLAVAHDSLDSVILEHGSTT